MKCSNCGKNIANITYKQNINGNIINLNLCEECAHKLGIFNSFDDIFSPMVLDLDYILPEEVKCKKCGNVFNIKVLGYLKESTNKNLCRVCHPIEPIMGPTKLEMEFCDFLNELGVKYRKNCRSIITPNEIDFYLPEYNIGF